MYEDYEETVMSEKFTLYDDSKYENHATNELPLDNPIEKAAKAYAFTYSGDDEVLKYEAFKAGAEWQKEQMMDKACEWLEKNADTYIGVEGYAMLQDKFFEDFRKAMEEEK